MCSKLSAQSIRVIKLNEVVVTDAYLKTFSNSQQVKNLNDSILNRNKPALTSLLNFNSSIYFKENGLGMVSSPSFRGTTAQQTAVIWNGININSVLNGQTDFNLISSRNFNSIAVRSGGGSVLYGSSAIGGSVHLNNELQFQKKFENTVMANYGSFNTTDLNYNVELGTEKTAVQASISRNSSDNDYEYLGTNLKNQNGAFEILNANLNLGFRLNDKSKILFYSQITNSDRDLSGTLAADSRNKYKDFNTRNLLEWDFKKNRLISNLKVAYLSEKYKFFDDKNAEQFSFGKAVNNIVRYNLSYNFKSNLLINGILENTNTVGQGSNSDENSRNITSGMILIKQPILKHLLYEIGLRKERTTNYESPLLYAVGINYNPVKSYTFKVNGSKNFRIPSFNDLYWPQLGNLNLSPETSKQVEFANAFTFKNLQFSVTTFYIDIQDMIQWTPNQSGVWTPNNVRKVVSKGIEAQLDFDKKWKNHHVAVNCNYAFTESEDQLLAKQLIYVPFHKLTNSIVYYFKRIGINYQYLFNGQVFTASDHSARLKEFMVSNVAVNYYLTKSKNIEIGAQANNIFNENYQNVAVRPMPGRNFNIITYFKF